MMQILCIPPRGFGANAYVLSLDGRNAVVIDPAQPRVEAELIKRGLQAQYVLLTHCHFDHVGGVAALQQAGAKVLCLAEEKPLFQTSADLYEAFGAPRTYFHVDEVLQDGQTRVFCGIEITALHTPGHTKGSACYLMGAREGGQVLFTGDTLFAGSIGRTDFPTGDAGAMRKSLQRLAALQGDMTIYAGHNEQTTLDTERKINPFLAEF